MGVRWVRVTAAATSAREWLGRAISSRNTEDDALAPPADAFWRGSRSPRGVLSDETPPVTRANRERRPSSIFAAVAEAVGDIAVELHPFVVFGIE